MTTQRANTWSLTINNPTKDDEEAVQLARSKGWKVEGQIEQGKEGTRHYQLMVRTPQLRFSAVKKVFPRAHIEIARNVSALQSYVNKEDTRIGTLPGSSSKYPSVSKMWELIFAHFTADKDGLDLMALPNDIRFYRQHRETLFAAAPLALLDEAVRGLITEGYYVEHHACNPQIRQQWKLFAREILTRTAHELSQTDRQTDSVQSVDIPVSVESTTNDADDDTRTEATSGFLEGEHVDQEASSTSRTEDEEGSTEDC